MWPNKRIRTTFQQLINWTADRPILIDSHCATLYIGSPTSKPGALLDGTIVPIMNGWVNKNGADQSSSRVEFPVILHDGQAVRYAERIAFQFDGVALLVQHYIEDAPTATFD